MADFDPTPLKVLAFDVFGTVVDWHGSIVREVQALGLGVDAGAFALDWRAGYQPAMAKVIAGGAAWASVDVLHREILDGLLVKYGLQALGEARIDHLNKAWHRLDPWGDSVEGLWRLKAKYILCTLSNGNISLLVDMAKHAGLPWDCVLSAETFRRYKPDPETYRGVARTFDVAPDRVLMVAAHQHDLAGARACGLGTAYVERPREFGAGVPKDVSADPANSLHVVDLLDLAQRLGC